MTDNFSFETKEDYKTYTGRRNKKLRQVLNYSLLIIVWFVIAGFYKLQGESITYKLSVIGEVLACAMLVRIIYSFLACYWVRNYIVKLTFDNGIITVDYAHYDVITRYTATLDDIEIDRSINFFSLKGPSPKFEHYLSLNFLKDNIEITQGKTLDWDDSIIDTFIGVVKHYTTEKVTTNAG